MRAQIEILSEVFAEWLQIHEMDYDYWIYTQETWAKKEGETRVLQGAELIMAFENDLVYIFNYSGHWEVEEELQDLSNGFGYYFEFGNHWNIGFYPLEDWLELPPQNTSYSEILKDYRWQNKRRRIISRSKNRCENCGVNTSKLEVHHCYYRYGRYPWQYPDATLLALCKSCHKDRGKIELKWRGFMPSLTTEELSGLQQTLRSSIYWYDRKLLFDFLTALYCHDTDHQSLLRRLLASRSHPEDRQMPGDKIL